MLGLVYWLIVLLDPLESLNLLQLFRCDDPRDDEDLYSLHLFFLNFFLLTEKGRDVLTL